MTSKQGTVYPLNLTEYLHQNEDSFSFSDFRKEM